MYAIRIFDAIESARGFLGTADEGHIVTSAADARRYPTVDAAERHLRGLRRRPMHFLTAPSYRAFVIAI